MVVKGDTKPLVRLVNRINRSSSIARRSRRRDAGWQALLLPILLIIAARSLVIIKSYRQLMANDNYATDSYLESGVPPLPPKRPDFWENNQSSCIHVDNICHQNGKWFYDPTPQTAWNQTAPHQPSIRLYLNRTHINPIMGYDILINWDIKFDVKSSSYWYYDEGQCSYDSAPHHLVVQSAYNYMIGEFYSRTLLPLNQWLRDYPPRSNDDIQTYIHFVDKRKKLMVGHELFLEGLPNNNKVYDFMSLISDSESKDGKCQCYRKLIFCGYSVHKTNTTRSLQSSDSAADDSIDEKGEIVIKPQGTIANRKVECKWSDTNCVAYRKLRRDLLLTYSQKDKHLDEKIRQYQEQILIDKGIHTKSVDEWKIVGLAHRKYRRIWLNINEVISMCDTKFRDHKVVCITIDVEEATSPEHQFLMHRSLHAFIGVHGAQLTQGVFLPTHAFVLELLPWVPYYLWGDWVATIHCPTPLGVIFSKTQLNHVGYPLDRESVPLCQHVDRSDEDAERLCLMNETSAVIGEKPGGLSSTRGKFKWADRDFTVFPRIIEDFILSFLLKRNDDHLCNDMQKRANETNFVLYNAYCRMNTKHTRFGAHPYYKKKDKSEPRNIHLWSKNGTEDSNDK